jgi:GT2 family glycosyltransferase
MTDPPDPEEVCIGAVVVTHNSAGVVDGLLDSLPEALAGLSCRVVVVDCGSSDATVRRLRARGNVTVVASENVGYAAGINRGVAELPASETILVLNPDVRLGPGSVTAMRQRMRMTGAGIVAPRTYRMDGSLSASLGRAPTLLRASGLSFTGLAAVSERVTDPAEYLLPGVVDWAVGAVLLVSRACHDQLGGWDESYFLYSEEIDFCLRAHDCGWLTYYEPQAVVVHIGGASGQSAETHAMQILNRVRLYARRRGRARGWAYYGLAVLSELSWVTRGNPHSRRALEALLRPARRPKALGLGRSFLPR